MPGQKSLQICTSKMALPFFALRYGELTPQPDPARVDPISLDMIIKWVTEAAEDFGLVIAPRGCSCQASSVSRQDSQAQFSADTGQQQVPDKQRSVQACSPKEIIKSGIAEFLRRVSKEAIPEARRCDCMQGEESKGAE